MPKSKLEADLADEKQSPFHLQMLKDCRALVDMSRKRMGQYYARWDKANSTFESYQETDKDDRESKERKEPQKMVVPVSYSQVMTFVAFCFTLFTQRERVFELLGNSAEDQRAAKIGEAFIQRDLVKNIFEAKLFQFLLDVARYGIGVYKIYWSRETKRTKKQVTQPMISLFGFDLGKTTREVEEEEVKFLGNKICNISPYRFYPDTRMPIERFQEGEFCASEDEYSVVSLKRLEKDGVVYGIDFIKPMSNDQFKDRGPTRTAEDVTPIGRSTTAPGYAGQSKGSVLVTEVQRVLIPKDYLIDGEPLGPEDYPVKYLVWYANDQRVIRCEPLNYDHDEFTYTIGQFTPDQNNLVGMSLSDSIEMLQSVISWLINSHITSVRKVIGDRLLIDPTAVQMDDIKERRPVVRLKPGISSAGGIERYIKQLDVQDVTQNHLSDADIMHKMVQIVTGISETLLGQLNSGRRSATEARNSFSGATNRLKVSASLLFRNALEPMARQMLSNLRHGLDVKALVNIVGIMDTVEAGGNFLMADKNDLQGDYDFEVFDGTLPSEKAFNAEALGELLKAFITNPPAAIALQVDPKLVLREWLELRGIRNPERFALMAPPPGLIPEQNANQPNPASPSGEPPTDEPVGPPPGSEGPSDQSILSLASGGAESRGGY